MTPKLAVIWVVVASGHAKSLAQHPIPPLFFLLGWM